MRVRNTPRCVVLAVIVLASGSGLGRQTVLAESSAVTADAPATDECTEPTDPVTLTSVDQVRSLLVGTWIRCSGGPFPGALVDDVGIEVTADGHFYRVHELPDGSLARATGADQEGIVFYWAPDSVLNWGLSGRAVFSTTPTFFASPPVLRLDGDAAPAYYERWTGAPPVTGLPIVDSGACGALGDQIEPRSLDHATELVTGVWIRCAGDSESALNVPGDPLVLNDDDVGIEIAADGRFHRLYRDGLGHLIRAQGLDQEGTWQEIGDPVVPGLDGYQGEFILNTRVFGSLFYGGGLTFFFASPTPAMRLIGMGTTDYIRWDGDPPIAGLPPGPDPPCGRFADVITPSSVEQANELLIGTWTLCGDTSMLGLRVDGEVGLEITGDGRFHLLLRQADGTVGRASGAGLEGTWNMTRHEEYGVIFYIDVLERGYGTNWVQPLFFESPSAVRFTAQSDTAGLILAEYVQPGPVVQATTTTIPATIPITGAETNSTLASWAALVMILGASLLVASRSGRQIAD